MWVSGCRAFESFGSGNYEALFDGAHLEPEDVHTTRLNIAFDDHSGLLDIDTATISASSARRTLGWSRWWRHCLTWWGRAW